MLGRALMTLIAAAPLFAADDPNRAVEIALANALSRGDVKAISQLFDPKMSGYSRIIADVEQLLKDAESSLVIDTASGVWDLTITSRDLADGVTERKVKVELKTSDGRIESLRPADFLAPPSGRAAWDAVYAFAASLRDDQIPPALTQFDSSMPGLAALKSAVVALWKGYEIDTSLDLESNEGDDRRRTLRIAWTQTLKNQQDPVDSHRTEQTVECRLERRPSPKKPLQKQSDDWRIVSFSPAGLFDLPVK